KICNSGPIPMQPVPGKASQSVRCTRFDTIDWDSHKVDSISRDVVDTGDVVLRVEDLSKHYEVQSPGLLVAKGAKTVKANEQLTFRAREAETVAIVGESGCGKSTFAKVLMGLEESTSGTVHLGNKELGKVGVRDRDAKTVSNLQMVFQNPFDTLNPSQTVGSQIGRVIRKFGVETDKTKIRQRVLELLDIVKLPRDFANRKPRQLSGGQKQRIGIARAFAGDPKVVIADEPVSALDVSVQAAVTDLLMDIQRDNRTTLLFISHDLSVVRYLADRVVVMYLGQIMEKGTTEEIFAPPYHPYTEALLSAVPIADTSVKKRKIVLKGEVPSPLNPPKGCPFCTRCTYKIDGLCETTPPPARVMAERHVIACHLEEATLRDMKPVIVVEDEPPAPEVKDVTPERVS
ncbi:MAG: oligopeptide/dipeptide ABC transporter ATP-binding protein, partial [Pseudomonadota bacterium]